MTTPFERMAYQVAQKVLPKKGIPTALNKFVPSARSILQGDFSGAANSLLDQVLGPALGFGLEGIELTLTGGITLDEARRRFDEGANIERAKKNLWCISIANLSDGGAPDFNLFATEVGYQPVSIAGDPIRIGSGSFDTVQGNERVEMRVTSYDDKQGTVKRWFESLKDKIAHRDGTFGLPIDYLFRATVTHAFIDEGVGGAYTREFVMRPGTMDSDLSRREDGLEELQMTFVQFDTFTAL